MVDDPDSIDAEQRELWNAQIADYWVGQKSALDGLLAPLTDLLIDAASLSGSEQVADIGCGTGATALRFASKVGVNIPISTCPHQYIVFEKVDGKESVGFLYMIKEMIESDLELAKKEFRLFGLPEPTAFFGGQKKGAIGRTDAKGIPLIITCDTNKY